MSWLPDDWQTHRASGWWELCHLEHTPCGYTTASAYDLVLDTEIFGRNAAKMVVWSHECEARR